MTTFRLPLPYWGLTLAVMLTGLGALEMALRAEAPWRAPLGAVLQDPTDLNAEGVWWSYQSPAPADYRVLVLGASTAQASMDLPEQGTARVLAEAFDVGTVDYRSLCAGGATFAEYLALLENALAHGFTPDLVVVYTSPGMLNMEVAVRARRVADRLPLVSPTWVAVLAADDTIPTSRRLHMWLASRSALIRHHNFINGWLRRRLARALRGDLRVVLPYNETRYRLARSEPLENDEARVGRVRTFPELYRAEAAEATGLVALLDLLHTTGLRTVLVEAPLSPPARSILAPISEDYRALIERLARDHGASYLDPNESLYLEQADFADLYHVSWDGRTRWLQALVPALARLGG